MDPTLWQLAKPILAGQARHLLTVAAGVLIAKGALAPNQEGAFVTMGLGFVSWGATALWSWWQKQGQAKVAADLAKARAMLSAAPKAKSFT